MYERSLHIIRTAQCITDLIVDPLASTGSRYSTTDEQSWSTAAQCAGLWCLPCQVAGGGDTGDDAGQGRVSAGSALLYHPLTNRVTHCCCGPGREQTHCLASFKHETKEGQTEKCSYTHRNIYQEFVQF